MTIFLSQPLLDEPLFSVVGRYARDMRAPFKEVTRHVFGYGTRCRTLAYNLTHVAKVTRMCWGLSPREIAEQMTAYPYYAALLSKSRADHLFELMLSPAPVHCAPTRFLRPQKFVSSNLRFCEACFRDDRLNGVPRHWRRAHQLPGVAVCPWHGSLLSQLLSPVIAFRQRYVLPEDIPELGSEQIRFDATDQELIACHKLACLSNWVLTNRVYVGSDIFLEQFNAFWRGRALKDIELVILRDLVMACEAYFGREFLRWSGAWRGAKDSRSQLYGSRSGGRLLSPFRIVLLATACEAMQLGVPGPGRYASPTRRRLQCPRVECVNSFAKHGKGHLIERIKYRGDHYSASCSCGLCFTFSHYSGVTAEDITITKFGHETARAAVELRIGGMGVQEVAEKLGTKYGSAYRLLRSSGLTRFSE